MKRILSTAAMLLAMAAPAAAEDFKAIASAGGDITEILFELGAGDKVVAVDTTSIFPPQVTELPSLGYVRMLSAEGVLAVGADLLVGADDMGPPEVLENLKSAGMHVEIVPEGTGAERFADKVTFVADLLDLEERGAQVVAEYNEAVDAVKARAAAMTDAPKVLMILSVREGLPIAAGTGTTGGDMIDITGAENVAAGFEGWKPMTAEAVIAAAPELIVLSTAHVERMGGIEGVMGMPAIASTPAGKNNAYVMLNAQKLLQFGPRAPEAMVELLDAYEALK